MDSSSLEWLYHDPAGSGRNSAQGSGEVLALPRREELRVYRLLAGWAGRVRDLQGERSSVAVGSMITTAEKTRVLGVRSRSKVSLITSLRAKSNDTIR